MRVIGALNGAESDYRAAQLQHVISADDAAMSAAEKSLADGEAQIRRLFGDYEKTINGATDRAMWSDASARWNAYVKASRAFLPFSRRHDRTGASGVLNGAAGKQFAALSQQLDRWTAVNAGLAAHDVAAAQSTYTTSRTLLLIFALIAVLASLAIAVLLSRAIIRAVRSVLDRLQQLRSEDITSLRGAMTAMAGGDLTVAVEPHHGADRYPDDELGEVAQAVNGVATTPRRRWGLQQLARGPGRHDRPGRQDLRDPLGRLAADGLDVGGGRPRGRRDRERRRRGRPGAERQVRMVDAARR